MIASNSQLSTSNRADDEAARAAADDSVQLEPVLEDAHIRSMVLAEVLARYVGKVRNF